MASPAVTSVAARRPLAAPPRPPHSSPPAARRSLGGGSSGAIPSGARPAGGVATRAERQPWDFGRFVKTVTTFNPPPTPGEVIAAVATGPLKIMKTLSGPQPEATAEPQSVMLVAGRKASGKADVVMVAGATAPAGRAILQCLLSQGKHVRALVRSREGCAGQFSSMKVAPGGSLELAVWDTNTAPSPGVFKDISAVIFCTDGKQETDAILKAAVPAIGLTTGKDLFNPEQGSSSMSWAPLDDVVMGGCSLSKFEIGQAQVPESCRAGIFSGTVSTANSGGFGSVRTLNLDPPLNLSSYEGLRLRVYGDGQRYKFILRTDINWDTITYCKSFDTKAGEWQDVRLPFKSFIPVFRAKTVKDGAALDEANIVSMQLMLSKFEYDGELNPSFRPGGFTLPIASIAAFMPETLCPRLVVLTISQDDPKTAEKVQASGLPAVVVEAAEILNDLAEPRPAVRVRDAEDSASAEAAPAPISSQDAANLCASLLTVPEALGKTLYVASSGKESTDPNTEDWAAAVGELLK